MSPEGKRRRRRKPEVTETAEGNIVDFGSSSEDAGYDAVRAKRECPVPKPRGAVGELLGFKKPTESSSRPGPDTPSR